MPANKQKKTKRRTRVKDLPKKKMELNKEELERVKGGADQKGLYPSGKPGQGDGAGTIRKIGDNNKLMEEEGIYYF